MGFEAVEIVGGQVTRLLQYIFFSVFFCLIFVGFLFFLWAMKNIYHKRKGYLFTVFGFIGLLVTAYAPLVITNMTRGRNTSEIDYSASIHSLTETAEPLGLKLFGYIANVSEPIIFLLFYIGIFLWIMAAKDPVRRRVGMGMTVFAPLLWFLFQVGPFLYRLFI